MKVKKRLLALGMASLLFAESFLGHAGVSYVSAEEYDFEEEYAFEEVEEPEEELIVEDSDLVEEETEIKVDDSVEEEAGEDGLVEEEPVTEEHVSPEEDAFVEEEEEIELSDEDEFAREGENDAAGYVEAEESADAALTDDSTWLDNYEFTQNDETHTITLSKYKGSATELFVPGTTTIDGVEYTIMLYGSVFKECYNIKSIEFGDGVKLGESAAEMFYECSSLTTIDMSKVDTSSTADMGSMFMHCGNLESAGVSNFNTSRVTNLEHMFDECSSLTELDISGWDCSKAENTASMFNYCVNINKLDLSGFRTAKIKTMSKMFYCCENLAELDTSCLNTSETTEMSGLFLGCRSMTSFDLSNFDTSNVTDMTELFAYCTGIVELNLTSFDTIGVASMDRMFDGCTNLKTIYVSSLWSTASVTHSEDMFTDSANIIGGNGTTYSASHTDHTYARIDTPSAPGYLTLYDGTPDSEEKWYDDYTHTIDSSAHTITLTKYNGSDTALTVPATTEIDGVSYAIVLSGGVYSECSNIISIEFENGVKTGRSAKNMFYRCKGLTSLDISGLDTSNTSDMGSMFYDCENLIELDVSNFITSKCTNMRELFSYCRKLMSLDVSHFNTSHVTDMSSLFNHCEAITQLNLSSFDTSKVTTMSYMFQGCDNIQSLDLSNLNTLNVTNMIQMFNNCSKLSDLDISGFNTSNVTRMDSMFNGCYLLTSIDLSHFDTSNVIHMTQLFNACQNLKSINLSGLNTANVQVMWNMFAYCTKLEEIDLSSFDTRNVNDFRQMFNSCHNLKTIYVSSLWTTASTLESSNMFTGCTSLVGGNGTTYSASHTDHTYARIDEDGAPGYFSQHTTSINTANVTLSKDTYRYDGTEKIPDVVVRAGNSDLLSAGIDYTLAYENNVNAGTASVIVSGKGKYSGQKIIPFTIEKGAQTISAEAEKFSLPVGEQTSIRVYSNDYKDITFRDEDATIGTTQKTGDTTATFTALKPGLATISVNVSSDNYLDASTSLRIQVTGDTLIDYGTIGNHQSWSLDTSGVLSIQGSGIYQREDAISEYGENGKVKKLIIGEGITGIGKGAFEGFTSLTEIHLPSTTNAIHEEAFSGCTNLSDVYLECDDFVVEDSAFENCPSIEDVYYPSTEKKWKKLIIGDNNDDFVRAEIHFSDGTTLKHDVSEAVITLSPAENTFTYDGTEKKPEPTVLLDGKKLDATEDYTTSYSNNKNAGTAYVEIEGAGDYTGSASKSFSIIKSNPPFRIKNNPSPMYVGKSAVLSTIGGFGTITFSSSNKKVATVNNSGEVSAKTTGTTLITATASGDANHNRASCAITIKVIATPKNTGNVKLDVKTKSLVISVGEKKAISYTTNGSTTTLKSSNNNVATVSSKREVTGKKTGYATVSITAQAKGSTKKVSKSVSVIVVPAAPSSFYVTNVSKGMFLHWSKVTGAKGYYLYRGSKLISTIKSASTLSYTDTGANVNGKLYEYKIVSYGSTGKSTKQRSVAEYRLEAPVITSLTNISSKKLSAKWTANKKATTYSLQYSTSSSFKSGTIKTVNVGTLNKTISGLTKKKTYYVRVAAFKKNKSSSSYSAYSNVRHIKITK